MRLISTIGVIILFSLAQEPAFSQETAPEERADEAAAMKEMQADEKMAAIETEGYVTGEVAGVNTITKTITVKDTQYDDSVYVIAVNKETSFINASSLSDIKSGDTVNIDYFLLNDRRIADNVVVEERTAREEAPEQLEKVLVD